MGGRPKSHGGQAPPTDPPQNRMGAGPPTEPPDDDAVRGWGADGDNSNAKGTLAFRRRAAHGGGGPSYGTTARLGWAPVRNPPDDDAMRGLGVGIDNSNAKGTLAFGRRLEDDGAGERSEGASS